MPTAANQVFHLPYGLEKHSDILLVGAGRFERPTPCAQVGFQHFANCPNFQIAGFIGDPRSLLKAFELC
jgi:hypothetical protein